MRKEHWKIFSRILKPLIIIVLVLGIAVGLCKFISFKVDIDGQLVLGEARIILIALRQEQYELYANGQILADSSSDTGFRSSVVQNVKELHDFDGELHLLKSSKDGRTVLKMTYTSGYYMAEYDAERADGDAWKVYLQWRLDHLL
ncbi:MAG: hypothetical protein PHE06_15185 [Lachnospiraceae bacterium]|nr:hypothetical protein [Lachnospiraceae bacterium]MDD3797278.1 hypothetical protein [Lachnospiraceae bacterium]